MFAVSLFVFPNVAGEFRECGIIKAKRTHYEERLTVPYISRKMKKMNPKKNM